MVSIAALSILLLGGLQWLLKDRKAAERHVHQYGGMVAEQLTRLSKDAMVREDTIALNVLAEQVAGDEAIASVTIYSTDGRTLASYGKAPTNGSETHEFNRPIQLAEATAGFVRVTLNSTAFAPASESPWFLRWLTQAWRPLASVLLAGLFVWGIVFWLTRRPPDHSRTLDEQTPTQEVLLLIVRLFNSSEMSSARRDALMDATESRIAEVADIYGAQYLPVEPGALTVVFAANEREDQRFQAACAALAIAQLCNQPGGARYRYSLRETQLPLTEGSGSYLADVSGYGEEVIADSMLYAALAHDNTIAVSSAYARALERPERLDLTREHSPKLANLQTESANDYYLLSGANAATESMLSNQVEALNN